MILWPLFDCWIMCSRMRGNSLHRKRNTLVTGMVSCWPLDWLFCFHDTVSKRVTVSPSPHNVGAHRVLCCRTFSSKLRWRMCLTAGFVAVRQIWLSTLSCYTSERKMGGQPSDISFHSPVLKLQQKQRKPWKGKVSTRLNPKAWSGYEFRVQ